MKNTNNFYATIVAMYLAKYNTEATVNLGYKNFSDAFKDISEKLNLNGEYLKLRRDEFDPFFEWRKGWWNRPMDKNCISVYEYFNDLTEKSFRDVIIKIINGEFDITDHDNILSSYKENDMNEDISYTYSSRGLTGRKAEEYFKNKYATIESFSKCDIIDCRDNGCGYDFELSINGNVEFYVEVKSVTNSNSGLLFTDKEWQLAIHQQNKYVLCIVDFSLEEPDIEVIINPASVLDPKKYIYTSIQVNWNISASNLKNLRTSL